MLRLGRRRGYLCAVSFTDTAHNGHPASATSQQSILPRVSSAVTSNASRAVHIHGSTVVVAGASRIRHTAYWQERLRAARVLRVLNRCAARSAPASRTAFLSTQLLCTLDEGLPKVAFPKSFVGVLTSQVDSSLCSSHDLVDGQITPAASASTASLPIT
jgi:hypothetical protein